MLRSGASDERATTSTAHWKFFKELMLSSSQCLSRSKSGFRELDHRSSHVLQVLRKHHRRIQLMVSYLRDRVRQPLIQHLEAKLPHVVLDTELQADSVDHDCVVLLNRAWQLAHPFWSGYWLPDWGTA